MTGAVLDFADNLWVIHYVSRLARIEAMQLTLPSYLVPSNFSRKTHKIQMGWQDKVGLRN